MKPFFFSLISFLFLFFTACSDPDENSFIYHNVEGYTLLQDGSLHSFDAIAVADFIVVDRNFFEIDAAEIWQTVVLETWLAGELVHKKE